LFFSFVEEEQDQLDHNRNDVISVNDVSMTYDDASKLLLQIS